MNTRQKKMKASDRRRLQCESLERRTMLHGGGFDADSIQERVEGLFERLDGDSDGVLSAAEVSEGVWSRLSQADADESGDVSQDELAAHVEARLAERMNTMHRGRGRHGRPGGRLSLEEKVDRIFENRAGEDELLAEDEVSERAWSRISDADTDGDGLISKDELTAKLEAVAEERLNARIDRVFEADEDGNGLTEDEVSERRWTRLSQADANGDGTVTQDELRSHIEAKRDGDAGEDDAAAQATTQNAVARRVGAFRSFGRRR